MQKYKTASDIELLGMLRNSNHLAYNEIYHRYFHLTFVHAYKKLRDEDAAKDIIQDVFTKLWVKREISLPDSNLAGYLFISVRNKVFSFWAHENIKSAYWESFSGGESIEKYANAETDYKIREQQLKEYIDRSIQDLPPKMRRIFVMSRKEHLTHQEIADQLDTSKENVSKQITNALKILRGKLGVIAYIYLLTKY